MIRSKLWMRYMKLSWLWWLYMISVFWYHKPPEPKQVNGTYWMLWRADMYQLKQEFKDLKRFRKDIGDSCFDTTLYFLITFFVLHLPMLILNAIATSYLVWRIFAFRLGIIMYQSTTKKNGWWKRRKSKWKRGSTKKKGWRKRRSSKWKSSSTYHAHAIALNIDDKVGSSASVRFDADSVTVVCDNSANVHVCNDKSCFVGEITMDRSLQVATIGGKENTSAGIGTVQWKWKDDDGVFHTFEIRDVLYFPESPVNILSVTKFADQLNDDEGTGIDTKRNHSVLYWNENQFQRTIRHPASNLPEMPVNEGWSCFNLFSKLVGTKVCLEKQHSHCHANLVENDEEDTPAPNIVDLSDEIFHVGETLLYLKEGRATYAKIEKITLDSDSVLRFKVKTSSGEEIDTTKEFLRDPKSPDIGWVPTSVPDAKDATADIPDEVLKKISNPVKLSPLQEEFLALHERLWHLPFSVMFRMVKLGLLPNKFRKLKNKAPPCVSCLLGQAHRKPWKFKKTKSGSTSTLRSDTPVKPGDTIGVDQLISAQPGLVPQQRGNPTRARIWAATVFVDYATGLLHVELMTDQSGEATLECKHNFEHMCGTRGVTVKAYHADNGRFAERSFVNDIKRCFQRITFCGVGAHHQNGISENSIKQLTLTARTLLVHAQGHWPEYITTMLWPFALKAAQDRRNQLNVGLDGKTPDMKFSDVATKSFRLADFHTFGCPCYVLDARLQTNPKGVPKWEPRARVGIYLGRSPAHASNVALVLNPKTGLVSPQFHVVFDDDFTTVPHLRKGTVPPNWESLVQGSREKSTSEFYDLTKTWFDAVPDESAGETQSQPEPERERNEVADAGAQPSLLTTQPPVSASMDFEGESRNLPIVSQDSEGDQIPASTDSEGDALFMPEIVNLDALGMRRSPRLATQERKKYACKTSLKRFCAFGLLMAASVTDPVTVFSHGQACVNSAVYQCEMVNSNFDKSLNHIHHMVFAAGQTNNEVYTFKDMLREDDRADFIAAMKTEISAHEKRKHWESVPRSSLPIGTKTIQAIWAFKRKRFPCGLLNKHKARLCAHGGMQQWGVNYWETYAPVVNWISIRFLLVLSEIVGLESKAVDFVLAFPQADLDVPVYMELPAGMEIAGAKYEKQHVLLLKKNLYGLKQASANWYDMLKEGLQIRGFHESVADPCVFLKGSGDDTASKVSTAECSFANREQKKSSGSSLLKSGNAIVDQFRKNDESIIVLVYVDDCIILSRDKNTITKFIATLTFGPEKFEFTDEGELSKYLGVEIQQLQDGGFSMTQPFLIQRILDAVNIDMSVTKSRSTPVVGPLLSRDEQGPARKYDWKYRTLTGMLGYLQGTTRPDISMATHQCARFNADPKLCHERAIKRICKYLLATRDKGIIFVPDVSRGLECHVDADFAGGWADGDQSNPESVLSRAGYVISYAGCPIHWCSKMETEIALSTTEAEYIALSMAMRDVLPFLNLMSEMKVFLPISDNDPKFFCKVWEDNQSCIKVAKNPKFTPRTKHIALKYHHFRHFVSNGTIAIEYVATAEQTADIFTKPLPEKTFRYLRRKLMGW